MMSVAIGQSDIHGKGVFALKNFKKGEVIERCELFPAPKGMRQSAGASDETVCGGLAAMYNHSYTPNAEWKQNACAFVYVALREIEAGEEITVDYSKEDAEYLLPKEARKR